MTQDLNLFTMEFLYQNPPPEIEYLVDGLLTPGLYLLGGSPKVGKSWMALSLCLAVCRGKPFLGRETQQGEVLYLALEDGPQRLHAVEAGYLTNNPAWRTYKPKGQPKERPVADAEIVQKLVTALEGQSMKYEVYFKLILATGMRRGEACGLRWSDVDWAKRALHIRRNVVKLSRQPIIIKEPKTRAGVRVVYISKNLCQLLKAWQQKSAWEQEQQDLGELKPDDYLFHQPNGDPMVPSTFTFRFKKILRENDLPDNLNVHSLRHTNASLLIAEGVDVRTVASLLGHSQPSTTLDIYAHAFDKNKRAAQAKLGKVMGI